MAAFDVTEIIAIVRVTLSGRTAVGHMGPLMISAALVLYSAFGCRPAAVVPVPMAVPPAPLQAAPAVPQDEFPQATPAHTSPSVGEPSSETEDTTWKPSVEPREWSSIVLHHTATERGSVESIHETHLERGWLGIGYHFVIGNGNGMDDGEVTPTFRWREQLQGAHAGSEEFNEYGIGIALVGNFDKAAPSPAQLAAAKKLIAALSRDYAIPTDRILGHKSVKATACPGKLFPLNEVRPAMGREVSNRQGVVNAGFATTPATPPARTTALRTGSSN